MMLNRESICRCVLCLWLSVQILANPILGIASSGAVPAEFERAREILLDGVRAGPIDIRMTTRTTTVNLREFEGHERVVPAGDSWERPALEYLRKGIKERVGQYPTPENGGFAVSDGEFYLSFYSTKGTVDTETQVGRAVHEADSRGLLRRGEGPSVLFGTESGILPDEVLEHPDVSVVEDQINGTAVYRISAPLEINRMMYDITFWLDPGRSFLPLRMETRELNGKLSRRAEWEEFVQLPDGQWFPKRVSSHWFGGPIDAVEQTQTHTTIVEDFELHPDVDDIAFATDPRSLPAGTLVRDEIRGVRYTVGQGPVGEQQLDAIVNDARRQIAAIDDRRSGRGTAWVLLFVAVFVAIGVAAGLAVKKIWAAPTK